MSKIIQALFALIFIAFNLSAQSRKLDTADNSYKYDSVLTSKLKKDALYDKLKIWADSYFISSKAAIQQDDKAAGELFFNSGFGVNYIIPGNTSVSESKVNYKCRIYIKDEKIKVIVTVIAIDKFNGIAALIKARPDSYLTQALKASDKDFKKLFADINKSINSKSESDF